MILIYKRIQQSLKTRYLLFQDQLMVKLGWRHPLMPPKRYDYINYGENLTIANEFFKYFIQYGGLKPDNSVLEIGSGFGRMAIPLTSYLNEEGSYTGLEIIKDGVNWCQSNFTPKHPNFKFQHIDVYNKRYNPNGKLKASEYKFPFANNSFDFVFLTSVFTHMFPIDINNYLSEISRILKPTGRSLITHFIINEITISQINNNKSRFTFQYKFDNNYYLERQFQPEYAIAVDEKTINSIYDVNNLVVLRPIHYGNWSGIKNALAFQDIIVCKKK